MSLKRLRKELAYQQSVIEHRCLRAGVEPPRFFELTVERGRVAYSIDNPNANTFSVSTNFETALHQYIQKIKSVRK